MARKRRKLTPDERRALEERRRDLDRRLLAKIEEYRARAREPWAVGEDLDRRLLAKIEEYRAKAGEREDREGGGGRA